MTQPAHHAAIGGGPPAIGLPCVVCGRSTLAQTSLPRPHFSLPQPTPARQERVAAWLAATPPRAAFCVAHLRESAPVSMATRDPRLLVQAGRELWVRTFGHPLYVGRLLWRPVRRTPLAVASQRPQSPGEREQKSRASQRRRQRRKGRRQVLRRALVRLKFSVRGMRLRGGA